MRLRVVSLVSRFMITDPSIINFAGEPTVPVLRCAGLIDPVQRALAVESCPSPTWLAARLTHATNPAMSNVAPISVIRRYMTPPSKVEKAGSRLAGALITAEYTMLRSLRRCAGSHIVSEAMRAHVRDRSECTHRGSSACVFVYHLTFRARSPTLLSMLTTFSGATYFVPAYFASYRLFTRREG